MAKVTFKNILEQDSIFKPTDKEYLIPAVYEYARSCDEEIYRLIMTEKIILFVNNEYIKIEDWATYKLNENDEIVVTPPMGSDKLGAFLMIGIGVLMIIAPYASPALFAAEGALAGMAGYFALTGVALALGGISSLLFRPDLPSLPSISDRSSQTYNWAGIKTMARCDIPVPIIYGTHTVGGNIISLYTDVRGEDNYLNMLIALGEGEIEGICTYYNHASVCTTSDQQSSDYRLPAIELDDQPMHYFSDVKWWYRAGTNTQDIVPYFDAARAQYDDGREVTTEGITYTTTKDVDAATLHFRIPALYNGVSNPGQISEESVMFKIQYKKSSEPSWNDYAPNRWADPVVTGENSSGTSLSNPTARITVVFNRQGALVDPQVTTDFSVEIISISPNDNFVTTRGEYWKTYTIICRVTDNINNSSTIQEAKITMQSNWNFDPIYASPEGYWIIENFYYVSFSYRDFVITLRERVRVGDIYNITVSVVSSDPTIVVTGKTKAGLWRSFNLDFLELANAGSKDDYDIRILRQHGEKSSVIGVENNLLLHSVIEIVQGSFRYPNTALLGFRIRATGQLSGSPPNVTTVVKGMKIQVPDIEDASPSGSSVDFNNAYWNNDQWETVLGTELYWNDTDSWRTEYSNNSMLCTRDLVLSERYGIGDLIEEDDLYSSGVVSVIRECHAPWEPDTLDYFAWWNGTLDSTFNDNVTDTHGSITIDSSAREVSCVLSDTNRSALVILKLSTPLTSGEKYTVELDITTDQAYRLTHYVGAYDESRGVFTDLRALETEAIAATGTVSFTFEAPINGISHYATSFRRDRAVAVDTNISITDLSMGRAPSSKPHYHTYNGVLESGQSALTALLEMCDSFRTWPVWYDGKFNFVTDTDTTPVHALSKSNTESFTQSFIPLSETPYRLIGQYTDEDRKYEMTSLIAKSNSTSLTKSNEKTIGLKGLTNRKRSERELKWKLNKATNSTLSVSVKAGLDALHATAGDIITIQDDLPQWGYGGRVLSYNSTALTLSLDNYVTVASVSADNIIKYQDSNNSFVTASIDTSALSNNDSVREITILNWPSSSPKENAVYQAGQSGSSFKKFRLTAANRTNDDMVEFSAIEHHSSLYVSEPTITIIEDTSSKLPNPLARPEPPENVSVEPLPKEEGVGFILNANPPNDGSGIIDILVKIKKEEENSNSFEVAAVIPVHVGYAKYINNNLELGETYTFSFECRNATKVSTSVYVTVTLQESNYRPSVPSGIRLKNVDQNAQTFSGKDITIEWNPVSGANDYVIEVYHTSVTSGNILRTTFMRSESYTYSYENMIEDSGGTIYGVEANQILFRIAARHITGIESPYSMAFSVYNLIPSNVSGMAAYPLVGGVQFSWNENDEADHRYYKYGTKVGSGAWESARTIEENSLTRTLTATEIDSYGNKATVYCRVKNVDWFNQESTSWVETSATSNYISDNLFQIFITSSNGAGTLASLLDGDYTSGGITIA